MTRIEEEKSDLPNTDFKEQTTVFDVVGLSEEEKKNGFMISIFRDYVGRINKKWKITDKQILEIGKKIEQHIPRVTERYDELSENSKDIIWMNFLEDVLRKAAAEEAKSLYRFLTTQWDRYICEICVRTDI